MSENRQLRLGTILHGASGNMSAWRHPAAQADASTNLVISVTQTAPKAEAGQDWILYLSPTVLYINEKSIPHFLNRFEPLNGTCPRWPRITSATGAGRDLIHFRS
ncbi:hypothetical protein [Enterobacter hormaechei]|uniref:hypothetical protein n=1 Tax=Enterobacter hormaechei TaxID=158836 RepID=UPI00254A8BE5|nr:hypothetical protein [Enterobacter hormaechei]MEC6097174.1 hypothetical protein [Enterobacter hormaechei]